MINSQHLKTFSIMTIMNTDKSISKQKCKGQKIPAKNMWIHTQCYHHKQQKSNDQKQPNY